MLQCAQRASEMREKIKILQNEIEILRTSAQQKDRLLQKQRLRLVNSQVIRDNLRNAKAKQQHIATGNGFHIDEDFGKLVRS